MDQIDSNDIKLVIKEKKKKLLIIESPGWDDFAGKLYQTFIE